MVYFLFLLGEKRERKRKEGKGMKKILAASWKFWWWELAVNFGRAEGERFPLTWNF